VLSEGAKLSMKNERRRRIRQSVRARTLQLVLVRFGASENV
jgi:hypothetical protein